MKVKVVGFSPPTPPLENWGLQRYTPSPSTSPPKSLQGSNSIPCRAIPHSANITDFDLLFPLFIILFAISASVRRLHPSQPYSRLELCLPVRGTPSPQLKPALDWMPLSPASQKPRYPLGFLLDRSRREQQQSTAAEHRSVFLPFPLPWEYFHSRCAPGNLGSPIPPWPLRFRCLAAFLSLESVTLRRGLIWPRAFISILGLECPLSSS